MRQQKSEMELPTTRLHSSNKISKAMNISFQQDVHHCIALKLALMSHSVALTLCLMIAATVCHFLSLFLPSLIGKKIVMLFAARLIGHTNVSPSLLPLRYLLHSEIALLLAYFLAEVSLPLIHWCQVQCWHHQLKGQISMLASTAYHSVLFFLYLLCSRTFSKVLRMN